MIGNVGNFQGKTYVYLGISKLPNPEWLKTFSLRKPTDVFTPWVASWDPNSMHEKRVWVMIMLYSMNLNDFCIVLRNLFRTSTASGVLLTLYQMI